MAKHRLCPPWCELADHFHSHARTVAGFDVLNQEVVVSLLQWDGTQPWPEPAGPLVVVEWERYDERGDTTVRQDARLSPAVAFLLAAQLAGEPGLASDLSASLVASLRVLRGAR